MKLLKIGLILALLIFTVVNSFAGGQKEKGPVTVTFMSTEADLQRSWVEKWNAANPDINLVRMEEDWTKWITEAMAGTAADLNRLGSGSDVAYYVKRKLFYDMTSMLNNSKVIKMNDVDKRGSANYQFDGQDYGKGEWYGLPKDYNNICGITYNKDMFKDAGIAFLSTTQPITYYDDLYNLSKKLVKKDASGNVVVWGTEFMPTWIPFLVSDMAYASGLSFYKDKKRSKMNNDPKMRELFKYWTRFPVENISSNVRNPNSGWTGSAFQADRVAIVQLGYWFGAQLMENKNYATKYGWAPTPILKKGAKRYTNTLGATGIVMYAKTKHPRAAFKVFEWYIAGAYGIARAKTGWGIPPLFSMRKYLPENNEYNKSRMKIAFDDAKYFVPWQSSPYITWAQWAAPWSNHIDDLVNNKINADKFIDLMYAGLNKAMALGKKGVGE